MNKLRIHYRSYFIAVLCSGFHANANNIQVAPEILLRAKSQPPILLKTAAAQRNDAQANFVVPMHWSLTGAELFVSPGMLLDSAGTLGGTERSKLEFQEFGGEWRASDRISVRLGQQSLHWDAGRMLSSDDWFLPEQHFLSALLSINNGFSHFHLLAAHMESPLSEFNVAELGNNQNIFGFHAVLHPQWMDEFDLLALWNQPGIAAQSPLKNISTFGTRCLHTTHSELHFEHDVAAQLRAPSIVGAKNSMEAQWIGVFSTPLVSYVVSHWDFELKISLASTRFNSLYTATSLELGQSRFFSSRNLASARARLTRVDTHRNLKVAFEIQQLRRISVGEPLANAANSTLISLAPNQEHLLGHEIGLLLEKEIKNGFPITWALGGSLFERGAAFASSTTHSQGLTGWTELRMQF